MANAEMEPDLAFHPLTPERWGDLETLFGPRGACAGCWCMFWRLPRPRYEAGKGEANRDALHGIVDSGRVPGILAYAGGEPVGWCAVEPREAYPALERSRTLKPVDTRPVWSVTCFFVARRHRGRGVTARLLRAASTTSAPWAAASSRGIPWSRARASAWVPPSRGPGSPPPSAAPASPRWPATPTRAPSCASSSTTAGDAAARRPVSLG